MFYELELQRINSFTADMDLENGTFKSRRTLFFFVAFVEVSSNFTDVFSITERQQLNVLSMPFSLKLKILLLFLLMMLFVATLLNFMIT